MCPSPTPLISFIVTVYDLPVPLVRECLDSILALALAPAEREIILVDDGSALSPWEALADYHAAVRYLRHDANKGLSAARNTGMEHATGKFIQFVDGDDCLIKKGYDIIVDKLRKPDTYFATDIIFFSMSRKGQPRRGVASLLKLFWYLSNREYLTKKNLRAAAWGYVVRREIVGDLRFTPAIYHEDEEFTPLLLLRCSYVLFTAIKAYHYRQREGSITLCTAEEHVEQRLRDHREVILRLRHHAIHAAPVLLRRTHQLTMDYLYNALVLAADYERYCEYAAPLQQQGLTPLPLRRYTAKYFFFALLTRSTAGQRLLYKLLH